MQILCSGVLVRAWDCFGKRRGETDTLLQRVAGGSGLDRCRPTPNCLHHPKALCTTFRLLPTIDQILLWAAHLLVLEIPNVSRISVFQMALDFCSHSSAISGMLAHAHITVVRTELKVAGQGCVGMGHIYKRTPSACEVRSKRTYLHKWKGIYGYTGYCIVFLWE